MQGIHRLQESEHDEASTIRIADILNFRTSLLDFCAWYQVA